MKRQPGHNVWQFPERRSVSLIPRVWKTGWWITEDSVRTRSVYTKAEFCFRLYSDDAESVDIIDGVTVRNPLPHLLVKIPGTTHLREFDRQRTVFFIKYAVPEFERFRRGGFDFSNPCRPFVVNSELLETIEYLKRLSRNLDTPGIPEECDAVALQLIQRVWLSNPKADDDDIEAKIRRIAARQLASLDDPEDFGELARRSGFSRRSFYRHWQSVFSVPPAEFLATRRMELAASLLAESPWNIERISDYMHYPSTTYFIQRFKRHYGVTPAVYRRRNGEEALTTVTQKPQPQ